MSAGAGEHFVAAVARPVAAGRALLLAPQGLADRDQGNLELGIVGLAGGDLLQPHAGRRQGPGQPAGLAVFAGQLDELVGQTGHREHERDLDGDLEQVVRHGVGGDGNVSSAANSTTDTMMTMSRKEVPQRGWKRRHRPSVVDGEGRPCS